MSKCLVPPPPPPPPVETWIMQLNDFEDNDNKIYIMDYNYVNE